MPNSQIAIFLSDWFLAFGVLILTLFGVTITRTLLKKIQLRRDWRILRQLAPTLSTLLYILGLKIFVEVAPLSERVESWIENGIYILAAIIFLRIVQRVALIGIEWTATKSSTSETLQQGFIPLMRNVTTLFVFFAGSIMIMKHFNYDVMSLVTAFGVSSLAVGLAAKDTLSNMISGFILIIDRNLKPGDRISLANSTGDVELIGLRSTQIRLSDGNFLIVPNSDLVNTKILNLSMPTKEVLCTVSIRVPYSASFSKVKATCLSTLSKVEKISKTRGTSVNLVSLSEGYQLIQIGFWVPDFSDSGSATSQVNEQLLDLLQKENLLLSIEATGGRLTSN